MPDLSPKSPGLLGSPSRAESRERVRTISHELALAGSLLAASVLLVFLLPPDLVFGAADTDLTRQFLAWRAFAADSLRAGHLPGWNPFTFSGQPFLGGFQSALLYVPNLIFLIMPVCRAANLSVLIHLLILGFGMRRFAARRGIHPVAAGVCACLLPLSGAVFPHVYAGHLSNLCTMAWSPWIFAGLEDWQRDRDFRGLLRAAAAAGLQLFAGHVQYFFYTAVAAGLQALVVTVAEPAARRRALPAVAGLYLAAAALAAAQLFPGMAAVGQSLRHGGIDFSFARMFSFPPENLLTLVAPGFFGDLAGHIYWGRDYLWEMSVFVGISGLALAAAALLDRGQRRAAAIDLTMAGLLFLLAAGDHTPIFHFLYDDVPGFDRFRGLSKFTFPALIFLVSAIGRGADALIRGRPPRAALAKGALQAGAVLVVAGGVLMAYPEFLAGFLLLIQKTGESYLAPDAFTNRAFIHDVGLVAGRSLILAGATFLLTAASLFAARRRPALRWTPLLVLALEMLVFAHAHFAAAHAMKEVLPPGLKSFVDAHPGDYRVLNPQDPDNGYFLGKPDIWGNDPGPLKRYAEFITATQGGDPDHLSQTMDFHSFPRVYAMLRFRYAFLPAAGGGIQIAEQVEKPMPQAQLVADYRVISGRDQMLAALESPDFDPRRMVLLESNPYPQTNGLGTSRSTFPGTSAFPGTSTSSGTVRVVANSADEMTVEAVVNTPALLLITDLFSRDWRARPLAGSAQETYTLLPADYVLRAIPLNAGHHWIRIEYVPAGFRLGLAVSAAAWLLWLGLFLRERRRDLNPAASFP